MGERTSVVVTDIEMSFASLVYFMVKAALASVPALIFVSVVLGAIGLVGSMVFAGFLAAL